MSRLLAASATISLLSGCASAPTVLPSVDTTCERYRHVSANDAQIEVYKNNWAVMKPYAQQVADNNQAFDEQCLPTGSGAKP